MSNQQTSSSRPSAPRGIAPALTLMVLAPMVAEVLSGATRLSYIFVLIPEILVWGGGALLIRELVRRWGGGWFSMPLMGLCLSIAEETIIQQTSLAPLPWLGNHPVYGRVWGVNWVFFLFMLGYESVWVVLVPVQLTELLFPERGKEPWLRRKGLVTVSVLFLVGSYIAWFAWTQRARPITFHVAKYTPPLFAVGLGALAIVVLTTMAYLSRTVAVKEHATRKTSPWLVGLGTLPLGLAWYELMALSSHHVWDYRSGFQWQAESPGPHSHSSSSRIGVHPQTGETLLCEKTASAAIRGFSNGNCFARSCAGTAES